MSKVISRVFVEVHKGKGKINKPYPDDILQMILDFSGRKKWANEATYFEAPSSTIRKLKAHDKIHFIENGELKKLDKINNLPDQDSALPALETFYKPKLQWRDIQIKTLRQSHDREFFAHLHDMGAGKTAIMIAEAAMLFLKGKITGVLISSANGVDSQWIQNQIPAHLADSIPRKGEVWDKKPLSDFWGNPERLEFLATNVDSFRTKKGKEAFEKFVRLHKGKVLFIVDESHEICSPRSQRTRAIIDLGKQCSYRRIATGTMIGKSLLDAWTQWLFLCPDILGHKYESSFKAEFCVLGGYKGRSVIANKNSERFWNLIKPHCFRISESEIRKGKITSQEIHHRYIMDSKTAKIYKYLAETCIAKIDGNEITTAKNGLGIILRCQQVLCGFLHHDETGELIPISNQRLIEVSKIIKNHTQGPVIIWVCFADDFPRLKTHLESKNKTVAVFKGTKKERDKIKADFLAGHIDVLIANPASGGTGQNFQGACLHDIYYSYNYDQFKHWQSLKRIDRDGAEGKITHHFLAAKKSMNLSVLNNLKSKKRRSDWTLDGIRSAFYFDLSNDLDEIQMKPINDPVHLQSADLKILEG